ncbi:hypothetical protein OQA88_1722 [Cercophora sp. LCS_1]
MAIGSDCKGSRSVSENWSDAYFAAHIRELSLQGQPGGYTTAIQTISWHTPPDSTTSPYGLLSFPAEQLVAIWSASQGSPDFANSQSVLTPVIHIPQCRLDVEPVGTFPYSGLVERVAISGSVVRAMMSQATLPSDMSALRPHHDDNDDWVYSRCLLSDFSTLNEDQAKTLSDRGQLCCLASVVLAREDSSREWDLFIVVHKVTAHRLPELGMCACD